MKNKIYIALILAIWIIPIGLVVGFVEAISLTAIFLLLGAIGKYGSQALEDWLRGREARKYDELHARTGERLAAQSDDDKNQSNQTSADNAVLIHADLGGYQSATVDSILKVSKDKVLRGDILAVLLIETKTGPVKIQVLSNTDGIVSWVEVFEKNIIKNNDVLFEILPTQQTSNWHGSSYHYDKGEALARYIDRRKKPRGQNN
jgi:hypothetical protein